MTSNKPRPFTEDMPSDGLRAAYENYHATRHRIENHLSAVHEETGRLAEQAARIVQLGGEI